MMPSGHRGSSNRKPSNAGTYTTSSRHYHKSGDSGVGSLSDHDGLATNPGVYAAPPPDYGQPSTSTSSSRRLDQALLDIERLKADKQNLIVQNQELKVELRDVKEHFSKLKEDNTILSSNLRDAEKDIKKLHTENDLLSQELRILRSSPPRDSAASTSTSSSSGLRRRDSKRGSPSQREEVERDQRLRDRLGGKTEKGPPSSTSGHSGHSGQSGRSRRDSHAGTVRPSVVVSLDGPPNSSRSQGLYAHSPVMTPSPHAANASTPRTPDSYAYRDSSYVPTEQLSGDYVHEPLPHERQTKR